MKIKDLIAKHDGPFYSLEFFPPKNPEMWPKFFTNVGRLMALDPLFCSVTYGAGGGTQDNTFEITRRFKQDIGLEPMPHLTCVGATQEKIRDFVGKLHEIGVDNVLALRGDAPADDSFSWDDGEFRYASDLVQFVNAEFPDMCVGVAGYPTAHPESPSFADDLKWTKHKLDAGSDFIVSQLLFDVREYFHFVEQLRAMGVTKPVLPGILPIQSLESVRRILSLCGANIPGRFYLELDAANEKGGAEAVKELGIKFAAQMVRRLIDGGAPGIHLYTLNQAETCLQIADQAGPL
ncbi:methylenetetrahydrofolate reductase [NAD(P)H] [Oleidesulfovibrio sp.]|uniref:methylenetetrahydrofolate reductase [NAD(P)H] n=1 Tax=Oleidesulfovibrio sp. TaxID=2909707 RepID=UPI003A8AE44A